MFRRFLSSSPVTTFLTKAIKANPLLIFIKGTPAQPQCGFSRTVVQILQQQKVHFTAVNVLEDPEVREEIKKFSDWPTIPQVYVKGEFIGGCDVLLNMHKNGELAATLRDSGIPIVEDPPASQPPGT